MKLMMVPTLVGVFGFSLAWAFHLPLRFALIVGLLAALASLAVGSFSKKAEVAPPDLVAALGTPDVRSFFLRAQAAVNDIDTLTAAASGVDGSEARASAQHVLEEFAQIAEGILSIDRALTRINMKNVRYDHHMLSQEIKASVNPSPALLESQKILETQMESSRRLTLLRVEHLNSLRACAIGLEGVASQISEIQAMGSSANRFGMSAESLGDVSLNLESLRSGIAESKRINNELLEGF